MKYREALGEAAYYVVVGAFLLLIAASAASVALVVGVGRRDHRGGVVRLG